jgi:hypothetical protein
MNIFYSWQSDLPNKTNRGFIEDALQRAVKAIRKDDSLQVEPVIDRDTSGIPGSPNIAKTILEKIEQADIFVADVSIINYGAEGRPTPNPNVLYELGYARKCLGENSIILVQNTAYGGPEQLPFDLKMNRVVHYLLAENTEDKSNPRSTLANALKREIRLMIDEVETRRTAARVPVEREILRILNNPGNKIELNVFLTERVNALVKLLKTSSLLDISVTPTTEELVNRLNLVDREVDELVRVVIAAGPYVEGDQLRPFGRVIEKLTDHGEVTSGKFYPAWQHFRNYPALSLDFAR